MLAETMPNVARLVSPIRNGRPNTKSVSPGVKASGDITFIASNRRSASFSVNERSGPNASPASTTTALSASPLTRATKVAQRPSPPISRTTHPQDRIFPRRSLEKTTVSSAGFAAGLFSRLPVPHPEARATHRTAAETAVQKRHDESRTIVPSFPFSSGNPVRGVPAPRTGTTVTRARRLAQEQISCRSPETGPPGAPEKICLTSV